MREAIQYPLFSVSEALVPLSESNVEGALQTLKFFYTFDKTIKIHIELFLFRQFEQSSIRTKYNLVEFFKTLDKSAIEHFHTSNSDRFNILDYLNSENPELKKIGLRFVKCFYHFYEYNEIVIFSVYRHRMFRSLLQQNDKYRNVLCKEFLNYENGRITCDLIREESSAQLNGNASSAQPLDSTALTVPNIDFLSELFLCKDLVELKNFLNNYYKKIEVSKVKLIFNYFILECDRKNSDNSTIYEIPGLNNTPVSQSNYSGIDGLFLLSIEGLVNNGLFITINHVYNNLLKQ